MTGSTGPAMLTKQAQRAIETTSLNASQNVLGSGVADGIGLSGKSRGGTTSCS